MAEALNLTSLVEFFLAEQVSFVLVGALAAVAQGAPVTTHDVDIVHARTPENLDRLMTALRKLDARYRGHVPESTLLPDQRALVTTGHSRLMTSLGPLDCLGAIEGGRDYEALVPLSVEIELDGRPLRVLQLETIAELKRASVEPKDRLVLPVLEATLKRLKRRRAEARGG